MNSISKPRPLDDHHEATTTSAAAAAATSTLNDDYHVGDTALSNMIRQDIVFMKDATAEVRKYLDHMNVQINQACEKFDEIKTRGGSESEKDLGELKKTIKKLKSQIPLKLQIHYADSKPRRNPWFDGSINRGSNQINVNKAEDDNILHRLHKTEHTTAFENFKVSFLGLPFTLRVCLFCFLRFPEMVTIKKRLLIYWWIGEGLVPPIPMDQKSKQQIALGKTAEDFGNEFMDELIAKGFIEPIYKNGGLDVDSCRMRPFIRSVLTIVATRIGFSPIYTLGPDTPTTLAQYHEYRCLLNVGAAIIDGGPELFSKMNRFRILYLGRWQNSVTHHIEVTDTKSLLGLQNMKQLRFLSLRGISLITELPRFISRLTNLKILDLRACHNLEVVPEGIGMLKNLTHLDMSECYFLDHTPKVVGSLSQLQVLKGFVIGDSKDKTESLTMRDLRKLPKLRKLSIYTTLKKFPTDMQIRHLQSLETLEKLKISWSGCILQGETDNTTKEIQFDPFSTGVYSTRVYRLLPSLLKKLELECFPKTIIPYWLSLGLLTKLKKLYIRGGLFRGLDLAKSTTIEILRLKYLSNLEMDWSEFGGLFPNLIYLEKVECPRLTNFPCDENGVWMHRVNT